MSAEQPSFNDSPTAPNHPELREASPAGPQVKFIFWEHFPAYAAAAAEEARDCDVLAVEMLSFRNGRIRHRTASQASIFISSATSPQERLKAQNYLSEKDSSGLLINLLWHLRESDKRVVLLDIDRDHPGHAAVKKHSAARRKLNSNRGAARFFSNTKLAEHLDGYTDRTAVMNNIRDAYVPLQIEELIGEYAEDDRVAVLLGANHTRVYHTIARLHGKTTRTFITSDDLQVPEKYHYDILDASVRRKMFFPGARPSEVQPMRVLLHYTALFSDVPDDNRRLIEHLTDDRVIEVVNELDMVKAGMTRLQSRRRKAAQINELLARVLPNPTE